MIRTIILIILRNNMVESVIWKYDLTIIVSLSFAAHCQIVQNLTKKRKKAEFTNSYKNFLQKLILIANAMKKKKKKNRKSTTWK